MPMIFARKVWKLLVAVKDGLALLFLLLFFLLLYVALSARPSAGTVRDGALLLRLDGAVVEEPATQDPLRQFVSGAAPVSEYAARDVVRALRLAAMDKRVKAVVLDLSRFSGAGLVHLQDIGAAMDRVRAAKKPVLTYAVAYADDGVLLAAHASEAWVNPFGGAFVVGPGGNRLFYARLLDKLKVTAHVFRVGTYKSAIEPFTRDSMSPEARENAESLYAALWEAWKADVARARPKADLARVTGDPVGWVKGAQGDLAKASQAAGLVDRIGDEVAFGQRVAELAGKSTLDTAPGSFAHTPLRTYLAAHKSDTGGKAVGVVTIAGEIVDGDAGPGTAGGERIAGLLDDALDDDLAALVVRVDSPGGSILASEQIRTAIGRYKAKGVPVVVSMANLAASGGYWVSTPGSRIFAEPGTVTGSIGVFALIPSFERTLTEIGVTSDGAKTTPLSGQPDVLGGLSPEVSAMIQANVEHSYGRFLDLVGKARGKAPQDVDRIAQGRVWDGGAARQLGLVDQFGTLDDAVVYAAKAAKLEDGGWHRTYLGTPPDSWAQLLAQFANRDEDSAPPAGRVGAGGLDWTAITAGRQQAAAAKALRNAMRLTSVRGMQAYCLECPTAPRPLSDRAADSRGWLIAAARLLGLTGA